MNPKLFIIPLLLAVFAAACEKKQEAATEKPATVSGVQTEVVGNSATSDYYEAVGTVRAKTSTVLSAKIVGSITALRAREGDYARAGQTLIEIDNRDARTQVSRAQAGVREAQTGTDEVDKNIRAAESAKAAAEANKALAESTLKRYQVLRERKSVSPQEFDEVETKYKVAVVEVERAERMLQSLAARKNMVLARIDSAQADVAVAQVQAGFARIASPLNGVVIAKHAEVGSLAAPGTPLLTIEDSNYRLEAAVEESQLRNIRLGANAIVTIDALGQEEMSGRVVEIVPTADPASRSYTVKIDLASKSLLRSGLFGKARFVSGEREVLAIPNKALVQRGQLSYVYVVDASGIARMRLITLGKQTGERVEVLSGLSNGERIVSDGTMLNREGVKVQ
ncbi:MAG TPA: efflux RND transporter periplasmic adaptor subunit [Blastocatellia bacterium]|nr:efflux RND transporter periplasmic adaptor subunit [Blastocatellia bacterium]